MYLPFVAEKLDALGVLDLNEHRVEEARQEYGEALEIYDAFAKRESERFLPDVVRVRKLLEQLPR